ncbi:hypothetical protein Efla_005780 [Eimeria flavescens]
MESSILWKQRIAGGDDAGSFAWSVAYSPDGSQLVLGVGTAVLIVAAQSGDTLQTLAGHKGTVNALAFSADGRRFASGGADKQVILWSSSGEPLRHFSHSGSVQAITFNPRTNILACGTSEELALWCEEDAREVQRSSSSVGISSSSSHFNGLLVVRDEAGSKLWSYKVKAAVWTLAWRLSQRAAAEGSKREDGGSNGFLIACTFEPKLWLLDADQQQVCSSTDLTCDPLSIAVAPSGDYFVVATVTGNLSLWSREGSFLQPSVLSDEGLGPVSCGFHPDGKRLAFSTRDGGLAVAQLRLPIVHGLHRELYARRTAPNELTIRNLVTDKTASSHFDKLIHKVAVYKHFLAIQLTECIVILETSSNVPDSLEYHETHRLSGSFDCALMLLTAKAVVLCKGNVLELREFNGPGQRKWTLKASVRYVRVVGGPAGAEVLLVGLRTGEALYVNVHQDLPLPLVKHSAGIVCVDVSAKRDKLVIVDEAKDLYIYDLATNRSVYFQKGCTSAAWNLFADDVLAISGTQALTIKAGKTTGCAPCLLCVRRPAGSLTPYQQSCRGIVVGFIGAHAFCLHFLEMRRIDVNHTAAVRQYLKMGDVLNAYQIACIGATLEDWKELGFACLHRGDLKYARKCFQRRADHELICLINLMEEELPTLKLSAEAQLHVCKAYAFASVRDFANAAAEWAKAGLPQRAYEMFVELRKWADAQKWASAAAERAKATDKKTEAHQYAQANEKKGKKPAEVLAAAASAPQADETGQNLQAEGTQQPAWNQALREAAGLYFAAGQVERACRAYAQIGAVHSILEIVRRCKLPPPEPVLKGMHQPQGSLQEQQSPSRRGESPYEYGEVAAALSFASRFFEGSGHLNFAQEALLALGDARQHVQLLTRAGRWDEALARAEQDPQLLKEHLLRWGHELLRRDQPESAVSAFRQADREDLALRVESALLQSALSRKLYAQAAARSWALSAAFAHIESRAAADSHQPAKATRMEAPANSRKTTVTGRVYAHADPAQLPSSVRRFLVCYFRRLSEIYGVYFVLLRQALPVPPRAEMPPHAVLRACAFLWTHAFAPLAQPVTIDSSFFESTQEQDPFASDSTEAPERAFPTLRTESVTGGRPCWRLHSWWERAKEALEIPEVQKCLGLCGVTVRRRPKGIRASFLLQLLADAAFKLHDFQLAAAACGELRLFALGTQQIRDRDTLAVKVKASQAAARVGRGPADVATVFRTTVCGLCSASVWLLTSEAVPLGADLSCGQCGCPIVMEFGAFAPVKAVEVRRPDASQTAGEPVGPSSYGDADGTSKEVFIAAVQQQMVLQRKPPSSAELPTGPLAFQSPILSAGVQIQQPRETLFSHPNAELDDFGSCMLRLLELPHAQAEQAAATEAAAHTPGPTDMLTACSKCRHLFIEPPAHHQLLPGDPCICCGTTAPRTPVLPCAALQ